MAFDFGTAPLVTQATFEAITGVEEALLSLSEKAKVEAMVKGVQAQIRTFCNSPLSSASYVEVWDSQGSDVLITKESPIISVESIKIASDGDFSNSEPLAANDYAISPTNQFIALRFASFPRGRGMIEVRYTAGFALIPDDIQLALCFQYSFLTKAGSNPGLESISKMDERQQYDKRVAEFGMPSQVYSILLPYRKIEAPLSVMFARCS